MHLQNQQIKCMEMWVVHHFASCTQSLIYTEYNNLTSRQGSNPNIMSSPLYLFLFPALLELMEIIIEMLTAG